MNSYCLFFVSVASCICAIRGQLEKLRAEINSAKQSSIETARPQILAAEENLHSMIVDLDKVVTKVSTIIRLSNMLKR